jgi:hypothetical protein
MKTKRLMLVALLLLPVGLMLFFGCRTSGIVSVPVTRDAEVTKPGAGEKSDKSSVLQEEVARWDGIFYSLPKTHVRFTLKYNLWVEDALPDRPKDAPKEGKKKAAKRKADPANTRYGILLLDEASPTATSVLRPDPKQNYLLASLDGGRADISDYRVSLSEDGYLTAVNATYDDKSAEIISNTVGSAITIAKLVFKSAKEEKPKHELRDFKKTDKSFTFSVTVPAEELIPPPPKKPSDVQKDTNAPTTPVAPTTAGAVPLADVIGSIERGTSSSQFAVPLFVDEIENLRGMATSQDVPFDLGIAYRNFRWLGADMPELVKNYFKPVAAYIDPMEGKKNPSATEVASLIGGDTKNIPGVVYRTPLRANVVVLLDKTKFVDSPIDVYQFGQIGFKEIRSRAFSKRTEKLTLNKGDLTQHEKSATSSAAAATKALSDQTSAIKGAIEDIRTAQKKGLTGALTRDRDIRVKEIELDAANRKLELNQQKVDNAATPAEKETALSERDTLLKQKIQLEADLDALRRGVSLAAGP